MPSPSRLRDSTQIVLPARALGTLLDDLEEEFTVTIIAESNGQVRIIGSPAEIKAVNDYLARHGIGVL